MLVLSVEAGAVPSAVRLEELFEGCVVTTTWSRQKPNESHQCRMVCRHVVCEKCLEGVE